MAKIRTPANQTIFPKPHVQALANALEARFGLTNFGTYLGHSPPEGATQALDIFTPDNSAGHAMQDRVLAYIRENQKRFGTRYHIRRAQIWNIERDAEGLRNMNRTGNRTADHFDHGHNTQYAFAPGPFGANVDDPSTPTQTINSQGVNMLILNVKKLGIFMLRGDQVQHLQSPDHVLQFVRAGVPYQDRQEMDYEVFVAYTGWNAGVIPVGLVGGLGVTGGEVSDATVAEDEYDNILSQVRAGIDQMKQEYYDMMLAEEPS